MVDREGLVSLAAEIRQELDNLERIAADAAETWRKRETVEPRERQVYVKSTALELHNFYTAAERIFEHVAGDLNGALPQTRDWIPLDLVETLASVEGRLDDGRAPTTPSSVWEATLGRESSIPRRDTVVP